MVEEARARAMEIAILNPNSALLYWGKIAHARHAFARHIIPGNAASVRVVAHSFGALCVLAVVREFAPWALDRVRAIAFTDGVETQVGAAGLRLRRWARAHAVNWVCSPAPANADLGDGPASRHRSAGTTDHPLTTDVAFPHIWHFFAQRGRDDARQFVGTEDREFTLPHCAVA
jgi:hypothetical protein